MSNRRSHIHHKLARTVFWGALLLALAISAVFWFGELRRASDRTTVMINQLLDTVEQTAAIAAFSGNRQIGEDVLKGLLRNDIVDHVRLVNGTGLDLSASRPQGQPQRSAVVRTLLSPFGDHEVVGSLAAAPSARFTLQEARHAAEYGALNSVVLIGITALLVVTLVRNLLSRPLVRISNSLHEITAGEQERLEPLTRHRDDELGQLLEDINGLLDTLEEKFQAEHELCEEVEGIERQLRDIFETTSAGIFQLDGSGSLLTANPSLARVLRLPPEPPVEKSGTEFLARAFAEPARVIAMMQQAAHLNQPVSADLMLRSEEEETAWVHCLLSRQRAAAGSERFEGVVYDITERRAAERLIRHEADHDSLTGLLRRRAAQRMLDNLLEMGGGADRSQVVVLLDLDGFKEINDRHGHEAGDRVLIEVAKRLRNCVRVGDITARLGGDEFLLILVNCVPVAQALAIAGDIVIAVRQPIDLGGGESERVGVSVGIAVSGLQGNHSEDLIRAADRVMYSVKHQGKNGFGYYLANGQIEMGSVADPGAS